MKTIFDLRSQLDDNIYEDIQKLFNEPLKINKLEKQSINACIGCWTCWLKAPGLCVWKDQITKYYPDYINSDTVILLMDTAQGFIDHKAKAFIDRTIPHYNPYIEIVDGECHHAARYKRYPDIVFYFDKQGLTNQEEQVIEDYLYRTAYQFQSQAYLIDDQMQLLQLQPREAKRSSPMQSLGEPIDQLIIYNGSPRRKGSNSSIILNKVAEMLNNRVEIRDLKDTSQWELWADAFQSDKHVMFFMPLYVHAMPSNVMRFIEKLKPSQGSISFFVQSGFPESSQSHYLEAYFEQLAPRLGRSYLGTAIKGGVDGLRFESADQQAKMMEPIVKTIMNMVDNGKYDPINIQKLATPIRFSKGILILVKIFSLFGLINKYWDKQLKENNAYEKRFDCPYLASSQTAPK